MKGKTVVITGGTSCIGEVAAEKFAQMGARNLEIASPRGICVKTESAIAKWLNEFCINWVSASLKSGCIKKESKKRFVFIPRLQGRVVRNVAFTRPFPKGTKR
jgi:NAD(P)-dependent dehydrogenase (short-subunit alcohol dehydrogenase family)